MCLRDWVTSLNKLTFWAETPISYGGNHVQTNDIRTLILLCVCTRWIRRRTGWRCARHVMIGGNFVNTQAKSSPHSNVGTNTEQRPRVAHHRTWRL